MHATAERLRRPISRALVLLWLIAVSAGALALSLSQVVRLLKLARQDQVRAESLLFFAGTMAVATSLVLGVGFMPERRRRRAMLGGALHPVGLLTITSGNAAAAVLVLLLVGPVMWFGREIVSRLLHPLPTVEAWAIGSALGIGVLAVLALALAYFGLLRGYIIWTVLAATTIAVFAASRHRLAEDARALRAWLALAQSSCWEQLVIRTSIIGFLWINVTGALAPEMMADTVRQRMPTAALFARTGRIATDPELPLTLHPGMGELIYAATLAVSPLQATKILDFLVGLLCLAAAWALGYRLGGTAWDLSPHCCSTPCR